MLQRVCRHSLAWHPDEFVYCNKAFRMLAPRRVVLSASVGSTFGSRFADANPRTGLPVSSGLLRVASVFLRGTLRYLVRSRRQCHT